MRTNLLVSVERPEDLGGIEEMRIIQNPNRGQRQAIIFSLADNEVCKTKRIGKGPRKPPERKPGKRESERREPHFLTLKANRGRFRIRAIQYPLIKNSAVKKA
jgi:hypothetical protein